MALSGVRQERLYHCVQDMCKKGYTATEICNILELNRSSYYKWTHRAKSSRETENEALLHEIGVIYAEHNGTYGYRLIPTKSWRLLLSSLSITITMSGFSTS